MQSLQDINHKDHIYVNPAENSLCSTENFLLPTILHLEISYSIFQVT